MKPINMTEQTEAYHQGYKQGRFDEYADRMGREQAEKVRARLEKQKNCPYCHTTKYGETKPIFRDFSEEWRVYPDGSLEFDLNDEGRNSAFFTESDVIYYCPMCGRPLGGV